MSTQTLLLFVSIPIPTPIPIQFEFGCCHLQLIFSFSLLVALAVKVVCLGKEYGKQCHRRHAYRNMHIIRILPLRMQTVAYRISSFSKLRD